MARILLVEDNAMNRDMLSRRLLRKAQSVLIVINGQQGVEYGGIGVPGDYSAGYQPADSRWLAGGEDNH